MFPKLGILVLRPDIAINKIRNFLILLGFNEDMSPVQGDPVYPILVAVSFSNWKSPAAPFIYRVLLDRPKLVS